MGHEDGSTRRATGADHDESWRDAPPPGTPVREPASDASPVSSDDDPLRDAPPPVPPAALGSRDLSDLPPPSDGPAPARSQTQSDPRAGDDGRASIAQDAAARLHATTSLVGGLTYGALGRAAALPLLLTVLVGVVVGVVQLLASPSDASLAFFLAAPNWTVGNAVDGGVPSLFSLGGRVGILPLMPLAAIAWYLSRTDVGRRATQLRVALVAGVMSGLIWAIAGVILSIVVPDPVDASPRPLVAIGAGLATWVLAGALARFRGVRLGIGIFAVWSVLVALVMTGFTVWIMNEFGVSGGELAAAIPGLLLAYLLGGPILALFLGVWPFGVEPALGASLLPEGGTSTEFYALAGETAWLWLVPLVVLGLVSVWGWISTPPTSRQGLYRQVAATFGGILAVLVVATIIGSPRLVAFGGGESETLGLRGAPFSLLLPTLVFALFWAGALYLRANQLGVSWAALPDLDGRSTGGSEVFRNLAQKLQAVVSAPPPGYQPEGSQQAPRPAATPPRPAERVAEQPVAEQPVAEPPVAEPPVAEPPVAPTPAPTSQPASRARFCAQCGSQVTGRFCADCGAASS
jgi:hypothetical protein